MFEIKLGGRYKKEKVQREKGRNLLDFPNEYVVIDIETTGPDSKYDAIIEVAGIRYIDGVEKERYQELINPQYLIDSFISELTGITNEMLKNARFENEVMNDFYSFIGNSIVVAHNAHFDINFVYDSLQKNYDIKFDNDFVDTLRISRRLLSELKHHKLKDVAEYFNFECSNAHRATFDAELTFKIFESLREVAKKEYGTIQSFIKFCKKSSSLNAKDIVGDTSKIQVNNLLYDKVCVLTGKLEYMTRKEAMQTIADIGGINANGVTKKTNYLILGNFDYSTNVKGNKSAKLRKAEKYILEGQDLQILSENVFYDLISIKI